MEPQAQAELRIVLQQVGQLVVMSESIDVIREGRVVDLQIGHRPLQRLRHGRGAVMGRGLSLKTWVAKGMFRGLAAER